MIELLRKASKIFSSIFFPFSIIWNILIFSGYYLFLGPHSAMKYFERTNKYSIIPILRLYGAKVGKNCDIETGITFHNCYNFSNLYIGNNCHIGKNCFFDLRDKIIIENNVVVSMQVCLLTHIDMTKSVLSKNFPSSNKRITIEENSYIGANSTILKGVLIQESAFIGAGSLVNRDVLAKFVYAGVPAKKIKAIE